MEQSTPAPSNRSDSAIKKEDAESASSSTNSNGEDSLDREESTPLNKREKLMAAALVKYADTRSSEPALKRINDHLDAASDKRLRFYAAGTLILLAVLWTLFLLIK